MNIDLGGNIKKISEGINELKPEHKPFIKKGVLNNLNQIQFYVPEDVERDEYLKKNTYFNCFNLDKVYEEELDKMLTNLSNVELSIDNIKQIVKDIDVKKKTLDMSEIFKKKRGSDKLIDSNILDLTGFQYYLLFIAKMYLDITGKSELDKSVFEISIFDFITDDDLIPELKEKIDKIINEYIQLKKAGSTHEQASRIMINNMDYFSTLEYAYRCIEKVYTRLYVYLTNLGICKRVSSDFLSSTWNSKYVLEHGFSTYTIGEILKYLTGHITRPSYYRHEDEVNSLQHRKLFVYDNLFDNEIKQSIKKILMPVNFFEEYKNSENKREEYKSLTKSELNLTPLEIRDAIIIINTQEDISDNELFNEHDLEYDISKNRLSHKIAKQVFEQFNLREKYEGTPFGFFENFSVKFDRYPEENGWTTGPTKQILSTYNEIINYIISWNNEDKEIKFNHPKWVGEKQDEFYEFLTHIILQDINHKITSQSAYFPFVIFIPALLELLKNKDKKLLALLDSFKSFINYDINNYLEDVAEDVEDTIRKVKYDDFKDKPIEEFEEYINEICIYLINDMFEDGIFYTYASNPDMAEFIFDPDNVFLDTQKEKIKDIPKTFFSYKTLSNLSLVDNIYDNIMYSFAYLQNQNKITPELFISKIKFTNELNPAYNIIFDHMKQFITNYKEGLNEETKNSIEEKYETQEKLNETLLKTWTASNIITDTTELKLIVVNQPTIQIATCFNYFGYPALKRSRRRQRRRITYNDFVSNLLGLLYQGSGAGAMFGRGKRRKKYTRKGKKDKKGKKKYTRKGKKDKKGKKKYTRKGKKYTRKGKKDKKGKKKYTKKT